jgi:hypothetical protein
MNEIVKSEDVQKTGISFKDLVNKFIVWYRYLLSKWVIILLCCLVGGIIGFAYSKYKKVKYVAVTTFVLEETDTGTGLGQYAGLASMVGIDIGGGGGLFQGDNILELYKSRRMISEALLTTVKYNGKSEQLIERYIDFKRLRKEGWAKDSLLKNIHFQNSDGSKKFSRQQDSVIGVIVEDINKGLLSVIKPDKKLNTIKASVISEDEFFSKTFNEEIVKKVNDFYVETKTKKSMENVLILQQKTDSVRALMNRSISSAASIADATPNINPTRQAQRVVPIQRAQFSAESNKAVLGEFMKNLELSKISLRKEKPLIQIIDQPVYPLEKERLGPIKGTGIGIIIAGFIIVLILLGSRIFRILMS